MNIGTIIGRNVYTLRLRAGRTQAEVAARACISQSMISFLERGKVRDISVGMLLELARALEVTAIDLIRD